MGPKVTQQLGKIASPKPQRALPPLPKGKEEASLANVVKTDRHIPWGSFLLHRPLESDIYTHLREYGINISSEALNRLLELPKAKDNPQFINDLRNLTASFVNKAVERNPALIGRSFENTRNYSASMAKTAAEIISAAANLEPNQETVIVGNYRLKTADLIRLASALEITRFN